MGAALPAETETVVGCRAEKMFGIESRSLKACHELLEVRCAHGLLYSMKGLLAFMHPAVLKRTAAVEVALLLSWSACTPVPCQS